MLPTVTVPCTGMNLETTGVTVTGVNMPVSTRFALGETIPDLH